MSLMDTKNLLRNSYLCKELNGEELEALQQIVSVRRVSKGAILFLQGDEATGFYLLLSGQVRIYQVSPEGKEYTLHRIRPGEMFAEAAIFKGRTFPANCMAVEDSQAAFFPKRAVIDLLTRSPQISLKMIGALSAFVRDFNRQIEDLSLKEVPARIASWLLRMSEKSGGSVLTLDTTKSELATSLGTISETLSRNFKKLREIDVIRVEGNTITLLDIPRLQSIADGEKI
ncbi:MAG: Crp/Fnr family transcriptional regulator [Candidatus Latescibacterota bacterium]